LNWKYKAVLQAILSVMPFGESINYKLQKINKSHDIKNIDNYIGGNCIETFNKLSKYGFNIKGSTILEVGTGWNPIFPILFWLMGADKIYTIDHVRHVRVAQVKNTLTRIKKLLPLISTSFSISMDELNSKLKCINTDNDLVPLLESMNIEYIAPSDASRVNIPNNSLDLYFSYAVFEHVPEKVVKDITSEALRTLKQGAFYYNHIGLHDHYVSFDSKISKVNFLKYPEFIWSILAKNKITYLNRLRNSEFKHIIKNSGFEIVAVDASIDKADLEILKNIKLAKKFKKFDVEDLATTATTIIAKK
jgi:hypothetical protein